MFAAQLDRLVARALDRSPRARELCTALENRRLRMDIHGLAGSIWVWVSAGAIQISSSSATAADVTVSGSPVALLALAAADADGVAARGRVSIGGDEHLARQFQELARLLRPDLEDIMGRFIGRIPAHLLTRALSSLAEWGRAARDSAWRNTAEYLAHESRDLVPRAEAESFLGGAEALRARLVRAEARVALLTERLDRLAPRGRA